VEDYAPVQQRLDRHASAVTTICLIRHGETDWNRARRLQGREDIPLNDGGREQARSTAAHLARSRWDLIATSPLRRAAETAKIIAAALVDTPVLTIPELVERDYGAASGLTPEERRERFPGDDVPGIEAPASVRARAIGVLDALAAEHPGSRILVVAHGGVINAILSVLSNGEIGTGKTLLHNGCLSVVHFRGDTWEIESHNVTPQV
jgi:uncharacterized phosphatase